MWWLSLSLLQKSLLITILILTAWALIAPGCLTFRISDERAREQFLRQGLALRTENLQVNGQNIHFVVVGHDSLPTLVFLHGSPSSWNAFVSYMKDPEMLFHFRMASIDRPGFGSSDFGRARSLEEQALMLAPAIEKIGNGKAVYLVGHSLGGPLVIKMAAGMGELIQGVALIAGSVDPGLEPKETWREVMETFPLKHFLPGAFRPSNTELLYFKKEVLALSGDFERVTCPVHLIHGDEDSWVPVGNVDYARTKLSRAAGVHITILPGADHFIPWTKYEEVKKALLKILPPVPRN